MKIVGTTKYGYHIELSIQEIDIPVGRDPGHSHNYGSTPNPLLIGSEYDLAKVHKRIGEVLRSKEKLDTIAEQLAGLSSICRYVDLVIPKLERPEKDGAI
jgi:hypothetical protein